MQLELWAVQLGCVCLSHLEHTAEPHPAASRGCSSTVQLGRACLLCSLLLPLTVGAGLLPLFLHVSPLY